MTKRNLVKDATRDYFNKVLSVVPRDIEPPLSEQVDLEKPSDIPLRKARRVIELYVMKSRTIASIASTIHLTIDEVREVLHIVSEPCRRCQSNKVGDVTLVGSVLPMCRRCRREIDI